MDAALTVAGVARTLLDALAAFLALLLLASAVHKTLGFPRARTAAREFGGVSRPLAGFAALAALLGEAAAGAGLLLPEQRRAAALLAVLLWSLYTLLIGRALARGRRGIDCGCSFGTAVHGLGAYQLVRNLCLMAGAVLVAVDAGGRFTPLPMALLPAALGLLVLYVALDLAMSLGMPRAGVIS